MRRFSSSRISSGTSKHRYWWSGRAARAPQPAGQRIPGFPGRPDRHRILAALCAGTQSGGIPVGPLEATYAAQRMSQGSMATQRRRAPNLAPTPTPTVPYYGFLETVFFVVLIELYYAKLSRVKANPFLYAEESNVV